MNSPAVGRLRQTTRLPTASLLENQAETAMRWKNGWWKSLREVVALLGVLIAAAGAAETEKAAELRFAHLYSDHMVLQCGRPVRLSGYARPGARVFGRIDDQKETAGTADENGRWSLTLPMLPPGGPHRVTVRDEVGAAVALHDVLAGEVWFCAGQSNMEYPVWSPDAYWRSFGGDTAVREADYPQIRFVQTPRQLAGLQEAADIPAAHWQVCSPGTISAFSAVGYYFGRTLHRRLRVPVGLVECSWSGTSITPWLPVAALRQSAPPELKELLSMLEQNEGKTPERWPKSPRFRTWEARFLAQGASASADDRWRRDENGAAEWSEAAVPPGSGLEEKIDGAVCYRREVTLPPHWAGRPLTLLLGKIDDCDETWFNGVKVGTTDSDVFAHWDRPRRYAVPGELVRAGRNLLAVRVIDFAGGGGFVSPAAELKLVCGTEEIPLAGMWRYRLDFAADPQQTGPRPDPLSNRPEERPAAIFNGMVAPWLTFPMRGVVWYQGESNATEPESYAVLFPLLINSWRELWHDSGMAFVYAQLAPFQRHLPQTRPAEEAGCKDKPGCGGGFTLLREVQDAALRLPHTGMAVTLDLGDRYDIHPQRKQEVGYRLAREAGRICYGDRTVTCGPRFKALEVAGSRVTVHFSNAGSGLTAHGAIPDGFAIAGADGRMYPAVAEILPPDRIVLHAPEVPAPAMVRYGWEACPASANVFNREGFPLAPFRTDRLPQ